ncbi:unnamed protein product, partial [Musa banksii]
RILADANGFTAISITWHRRTQSFFICGSMNNHETRIACDQMLPFSPRELHHYKDRME